MNKPLTLANLRRFFFSWGGGAGWTKARKERAFRAWVETYRRFK